MDKETTLVLLNEVGVLPLFYHADIEVVKEVIAPVAKIDKRLIRLISESINDIADEDGWIFLGVLGNMILKKQPDFDPRNYGHKKLLDLIRSINAVEVEERKTGKNNASHFYVKTK